MKALSLVLGALTIMALAAPPAWAETTTLPDAPSLAPTGTATTATGTDAAAAAPKIDSGDTAWVLMGAALVLLMTPGLAFFYGGLVRKKNVLSILMQCMMIICIITLQWVLFGYSLAFGPDVHHIIGNLSWAGLTGVGDAPNADYAATIPHSTFMIFQCMFAVITPALILGAFAERMKFSAFCIFSVLWATLIYDPVAHWVWGTGGFLGGIAGADGFKGLGALDFAGGTVVHINAGMSALAAALFMGKRQGFPSRISPPHNLPFGVLGAGLLWFGWFGFNAGSALGANGLASSAFIVTHVATAAAGFGWSVLDWIYHGKPTVLGMITGAVAGLVAITPASGFVTPMGAIGIGFGAAVVCWVFVTIVKAKLGYDDSLDAFGVHGMGGVWGALATGLWATKTVNPAGGDGLFHGNAGQLGIQAVAVLCTMAIAFVGSLILLKVVDMVVGLRVSEHEERVGLDLTQHREAGYTLVD